MTRPLAILVHGFRVSDGGVQTVAMLQNYYVARGYDVIVVRYGFFHLWSVYKRNDKVSKRVLKLCQSAKEAGKKIEAVGHSNGCDILNRAVTKFKADIDHLTFINPALEKHRHPGVAADVWFNGDDLPVKLAKVLPKHPWGEMGRTGYKGDSKDVVNHDCQCDYPVPVSGHSAIFQPEQLAFYGGLIADTATSRLE